MWHLTEWLFCTVMINSPVSYLEIIFSAWRVEWGNAVGININNICKERDSWRHHSPSLNLSQCLSCGSAGSWLQRSDQQPIFMRTSQPHLSGMLWKIPILWERKDPVITPLLLLRKMIVGDQIKTYWGYNHARCYYLVYRWFCFS